MLRYFEEISLVPAEITTIRVRLTLVLKLHLIELRPAQPHQDILRRIWMTLMVKLAGFLHLTFVRVSLGYMEVVGVGGLEAVVLVVVLVLKGLASVLLGRELELLTLPQLQ